MSINQFAPFIAAIEALDRNSALDQLEKMLAAGKTNFHLDEKVTGRKFAGRSMRFVESDITQMQMMFNRIQNESNTSKRLGFKNELLELFFNQVMNMNAIFEKKEDGKTQAFADKDVVKKIHDNKIARLSKSGVEKKYDEVTELTEEDVEAIKSTALSVLNGEDVTQEEPIEEVQKQEHELHHEAVKPEAAKAEIKTDETKEKEAAALISGAILKSATPRKTDDAMDQDKADREKQEKKKDEEASQIKRDAIKYDEKRRETVKTEVNSQNERITETDQAVKQEEIADAADDIVE